VTGRIELSEAKRQLMQRMMSGAGSGRIGEGSQVVPRESGVIAPMSPDQGQLWMHAAMSPDAPIYNEAITIHRKGSFDLAVMERSFNEILRRHEIWRTSFQTIGGGEFFQIVHPDLQVRLTVDDLTSLPPSERDGEALRLATGDVRLPIDLSKAPLFRARVVKLAGGEHRLYLAIHHIIFDGVALTRVFVPELAAIYDAFSRGEDSPLAEPALQYGDYAIWRRQHLDGDRIARQMAYWRRTLSGPLPKLELSGDHPRPPSPSYRGSMEMFTLSREVTEALKAFSRAEGATLYMTLLAAFKAMLFRYTGQEDLLIGGVTDLRRRPELEQLMGFFLNAVVLRTRPSADLTFRNYLAQVRTCVLGALDAGEAPFDRLVRELAVAREPGANPIFQVMFSIQPLVDAFPDGWDFTQMDVVTGGAKVDLCLELEERPDGICGRFIYRCDLFEAGTIRRMIGHWRTILDGAIADPGETLGRLPLMTPPESRQILQDWNATDAPVAAATLHHWFQAQAQRTPDAIAVVFEDQAWTYDELDRRSDAVASRLQKAGVTTGSLVGICMNRSLAMVAGLLGIMKAGGAYLPLDPSFPRPRLAYIIENAEPKALLTEAGLRTPFDAANLPLILCDSRADAEPPPTAVDANGESLAYVLYTSGSTGRPKGVEVPHSALVNLLAAMQCEMSFTLDDSLLAVTTLSFDLAAFELFLPLVSGGRVVIASRDVASDPRRLISQIGRSGCTVMSATPTTWRALIEAGWPGTEGIRILCGGEAMPRSLADDLLKRSGALWNGYGPTETTVGSTMHRVRPGAGPAPIGRPIANTQLYILDPTGAAVPIGVVGELYIGGAGVARGYRKRPDLTRERFVEHAIAPGVRLYRTGDLARYRPDGAVEYCGRIDADEKIRGFRVAVEEVEAALGRHPDIGSAAVRAWPDASGNSALAGYFVPRNQREPTAAELRRFLGETLPDFMIPSRFVRLQALPMTPSGKVDRQALPEANEGGSRAAFAPPEGEVEEKLAEIWKEVLGVPAVGRDENFFDLGGHSLLVVNLLRRIEQEYGRRLTLAAFFHAPSIEGLARLLGDGANLDAPLTIAIQPRGSRPALLWLDADATFMVLSRVLGLDQPFLGIPVVPVLERNANSAARLEDVAASVAKAVREAQPEGPYYLGGWCNMGALAYEVAHQLLEEGQAVGLVVLLDSTNPVSYRRIRRTAFILSQIRYYWPRFWRLWSEERLKYLAERIRGLFETFGILRVRPRDREQELRAQFARVVLEYQPPAYFGDVALFQPMLRLDVLDFRPGWAERVKGELVAYDVPGSHVTMLKEPHVQELGALMSATLIRAQERAARPLARGVAGG
jgi:amino acid adenylation domain-containing protein